MIWLLLVGGVCLWIGAMIGIVAGYALRTPRRDPICDPGVLMAAHREWVERGCPARDDSVA